MVNELLKISKHMTPYIMDSLFTKWYKCPYCYNNHISSNFRYCPDCGKEINWVD